jgi:hypothetical protein
LTRVQPIILKRWQNEQQNVVHNLTLPIGLHYN